MADAKKRSVDVAAQKMIDCACEAGVDISWDRLEAQDRKAALKDKGLDDKSNAAVNAQPKKPGANVLRRRLNRSRISASALDMRKQRE